MKRNLALGIACKLLTLALLPLPCNAQRSSEDVDYGLKRLFPDNDGARNSIKQCLNTLAQAPSGSVRNKISQHGSQLAYFRGYGATPLNRYPYIAAALKLVNEYACEKPTPSSLYEAQRIARYTNILTHPNVTTNRLPVEDFRLHLCIKVFSPQMAFVGSEPVKIDSLSADQLQQARAWCSSRDWP